MKNKVKIFKLFILLAGLALVGGIIFRAYKSQKINITATIQQKNTVVELTESNVNVTLPINDRDYVGVSCNDIRYMVVATIMSKDVHYAMKQNGDDRLVFHLNPSGMKADAPVVLNPANVLQAKLEPRAGEPRESMMHFRLVAR